MLESFKIQYYSEKPNLWFDISLNNFEKYEKTKLFSILKIFNEKRYSMGFFS